MTKSSKPMARLLNKLKKYGPKDQVPKKLADAIQKESLRGS